MSQIKLKHSGGNSVIISAPDNNPASDVTLKLPQSDGSANQRLITDGSGNLSFASAAAGGKILQVLQTFKADTTSYQGNSQTSWVDISGMSVSITPTSASSKILIIFSVSISQETDDRNNSVRLLRNSTNICIGTSGTNRNAAIIIKTRANKFMECYTQTFLDSPNTTSATTYKLQWAAEGSGGARYIYLNRIGQSTDVGAVSSITVMEVAA